jgi:hypothetical protein
LRRSIPLPFPRIPLPGLVAATLLTSSHLGHAQQERDGVYGRFDGDLELRAHAGAAFASGGPGLAAQVTLLYLCTAGVYVHYTDALGSGSPAVARSISTGVHLEPLFLGRLGSGLERGPAFVDLLIDSLAFEIGAVWRDPRLATWEDQPGLEAALAVGVPLAARATGPWLGLRAALRWRPSDFVPGAPSTVADRGAVLSLTLGWHHVRRTHVVDGGDRVVP